MERGVFTVKGEIVLRYVLRPSRRVILCEAQKGPRVMSQEFPCDGSGVFDDIVKWFNEAESELRN